MFRLTQLYVFTKLKKKTTKKPEARVSVETAQVSVSGLKKECSAVALSDRVNLKSERRVPIDRL